MQESTFTNYDQLPLFLNANHGGAGAGACPCSSAYELMHDEGLPGTADRQPHRGAQRKTPVSG